MSTDTALHSTLGLEFSFECEKNILSSKLLFKYSFLIRKGETYQMLCKDFDYVYLG